MQLFFYYLLIFFNLHWLGDYEDWRGMLGFRGLFPKSLHIKVPLCYNIFYKSKVYVFKNRLLKNPFIINLL